jgi:hypothetical protein
MLNVCTHEEEEGRLEESRGAKPMVKVRPTRIANYNCCHPSYAPSPLHHPDGDSTFRAPSRDEETPPLPLSANGTTMTTTNITKSVKPRRYWSRVLGLMRYPSSCGFPPSARRRKCNGSSAGGRREEKKERGSQEAGVGGSMIKERGIHSSMSCMHTYTLRTLDAHLWHACMHSHAYIRVYIHAYIILRKDFVHI